MSLFTPTQLSNEKEFLKDLEHKVDPRNPYSHLIQDKAEVHRQLRNQKKFMEAHAPQEVPAAERDALVKETDRLKEEFTQGMLSDADMRACPPGAIDRHRAWEKENKAKVLKWKDNMRRLHIDTDDVDLTNIEKFRPKTPQLNLDNAIVQRQDYYIPENVGNTCVISDEELKIIKEKAPDVYKKLALMDNEQRRLVLQTIVYEE